MARSERLRLRDLHGVHQLVGKCGEMWDDPAVWRMHLIEGLTSLVGARVGYSVFNYDKETALSKSVPEQEVRTCGWHSRREQIEFEAAMALPITETTPEAIPYFARLPKSGFVSTSLHEVMGPSRWERSYAYNEFHRPSRINGMTISLQLFPDGRMNHLAASRDQGDPTMTRRHERIIGHLHREISKHIGQRLATEQHVGRHLLTPRLREVLDLLLEGFSEKEIAGELHRAQPTIHRHVTEIYKRFDVASRGELLAYFIRRQPKPIRSRHDEW